MSISRDKITGSKPTSILRWGCGWIVPTSELQRVGNQNCGKCFWFLTSPRFTLSTETQLVPSTLTLSLPAGWLDPVHFSFKLHTTVQPLRWSLLLKSPENHNQKRGTIWAFTNKKDMSVLSVRVLLLTPHKHHKHRSQSLQNLFNFQVQPTRYN